MLPQCGGGIVNTFGTQPSHQTVAKSCQHIRSIPLADLTGVFAKGHVTDVVRTVFDGPVPEVPTQQDGSITSSRGTLVIPCVTSCSPSPPRYRQRSLRQTWDTPGQTRRSFQTATFAAEDAATEERVGGATTERLDAASPVPTFPFPRPSADALFGGEVPKGPLPPRHTVHACRRPASEALDDRKLPTRGARGADPSR